MTFVLNCTCGLNFGMCWLHNLQRLLCYVAATQCTLKFEVCTCTHACQIYAHVHGRCTRAHLYNPYMYIFNMVGGVLFEFW